MSPRACSVVIPAYNAPKTIGSAIESILAQTRSDLELIVVDDGSSDETPDVIRDYETRDSRVRLVEQTNQGVAGARNTGIAQSGGEFVSFLDNDDLWMPTYLAAMTAALDANPRAGFAYTDGWTLDDASKQIWVESTMSGADPPETPPADSEELLVRLIQSNFVLSSATVRRRVLVESGGFDPSLNGVDEYDLWLRIAVAGHVAARAPGRLVIQRDRFDSQSKDELMMIEGLVEVLGRVAANEGATQRVRDASARRVEDWAKLARGLRGDPGLETAAFKARRAAGRLKRAVSPGPDMFEEPPPEIAEAFPNLSAI
jgi:glycosyltransferase involved in cell wall biosynthesis